ncbi:MAG: IclR family transcriptional regulator [Alcaligenaceae bacterium]|nr:IclR family transcriptional regulator [Alcaligenaceae bacterium]
MTSPANDRRQRVQAAETGLAILKALTRLGGAASLTAIGNEVGESTAKVHRYLASFVQEGFVVQNPQTLQYHLGTESIRLGLAALRQCDPVRLGEGALLRMRESLETTCFIAVMGNIGPTVLRMEEPPLPVTVNIRPSSVLPLLWSATGQVFLAFTDNADIQQRARQEYAAGSADQRALIPDGPQAIAALCGTVRAQGCAIVRDMLLRGISAVSAPIFDANGHVSAVLTALGASSGFDFRLDGKVCSQIIGEAASISAAMGYLSS